MQTEVFEEIMKTYLTVMEAVTRILTLDHEIMVGMAVGDATRWSPMKTRKVMHTR